MVRASPEFAAEDVDVCSPDDNSCEMNAWLVFEKACLPRPYIFTVGVLVVRSFGVVVVVPLGPLPPPRWPGAPFVVCSCAGAARMLG
jgi:hypothetical protein